MCIKYKAWYAHCKRICNWPTPMLIIARISLIPYYNNIIYLYTQRAYTYLYYNYSKTFRNWPTPTRPILFNFIRKLIMHRTGIITQYVNTWKHSKLTYANFNFMHTYMYIRRHCRYIYIPGMIICIYYVPTVQYNKYVYTSQLTYTNSYNRMRIPT